MHSISFICRQDLIISDVSTEHDKSIPDQGITNRAVPKHFGSQHSPQLLGIPAYACKPFGQSFQEAACRSIQIQIVKDFGDSKT